MSLPALPELTNEQINKSIHIDHDPHFAGCFSKNKVPLHLKQQYYIVNLDNSTGPGTHWVLLDNRRASECMYVDSYGMPPPNQVATAMQNTGKELVYNDCDVQSIGTNSCGYWAEYFAKQLADPHHSLLETVWLVHDEGKPERYMKDIVIPPKKAGEPFRFNTKKFYKYKKIT